MIKRFLARFKRHKTIEDLPYDKRAIFYMCNKEVWR